MENDASKLEQQIFDLEDKLEAQDVERAMAYIDLQKEKESIEKEKTEIENQNSEITKQNEELTSQNKKLRLMLQQALNFIERVKISRICRLLFGKDLKAFNQGLPEPAEVEK